MRFKTIGIILLLFVLILSGCSRNTEKQPDASETTLNVYATFHPLYAIADMITANVDSINLHCLVQPQDGCLRDYRLSDWDLALLAGADAVIAGGCGLESFENTLYALGENGPMVISSLYGMDLVESNAVNTSADSDSHWSGLNPHIYMHIDGAIEIAQRICAAMIMVDSEHESLYTANLETTVDKLNKLESTIQQTMQNLHKQRVIIMNEALVYAAKAYDLKVELCYARESGENLEENDLQQCLETLKASDSKVILIEKQAPHTLVKALRDAGFAVIPMNTMSTFQTGGGAAAYFNAHTENLHALTEIFSAKSNELN